MDIKFPARDKHLTVCAKFEKSLDDTLDRLKEVKDGFIKFQRYEAVTQFLELETRLEEFKSDYEKVAKGNIYSHLKDKKQ